jgi:DNA-binding transcriptional MerR regulator
MRVEELAGRAGVSVDTVRFYQKQRLLPPPVREGRVAWYTADHLDRIERVRELRRRGFTLAVIRRFLSGELEPADEPLAAAVAGAETGELVSAEELARRSGVPLPLIEAISREGLLVPRVAGGDTGYTADDVRIVSAGLQLLQQGLPLPGLLELARIHHTAVRAVAERAVELFDVHVRQPLRESDLPEAEKAERLVEAFRVLLPAVSEIVAHHFRRVLLLVAQEHLEAVGHPEEIAAAGAATEVDPRLAGQGPGGQGRCPGPVPWRPGGVPGSRLPLVDVDSSPFHQDGQAWGRGPTLWRSPGLGPRAGRRSRRVMARRR